MKLPNGFGSVYKLSGNRRKPFVARKTTGWTFNEETKKSFPIYEFIGYYQTRKEALTALTEYNKNPYDIEASKITFEEVFEKWSKEKFPTVSESNVHGINASYKLCDSIKDMKMVDIKLSHLQHIVDTSGKNAPTLKKLKITFNQIWEWCVIHEILAPEKQDFIRYLDVSKAGNPNAIDRQPFTKKQVDLIWKLKDSNEYMTVILMLIYTGVRIGELLDLKKEDVHLDEKWFYIRESKTPSGIREVPIADKVLPFFQHWYQKDCDYLICTEQQEHFGYRNYYDSYWTPMMEICGSDFIKHRPHDTRHTCISMMTEAGVDERILKKIVGHKGQGVTENVYTHIELPKKLEAINKI